MDLKGIDAFVKILSQKEKEGRQEFRSLEVRGKLIALKNKKNLSTYFLIFQKNHISEDFLNDLGILRPGNPLCVTASQKGQSNSGVAFTYAIMNKSRQNNGSILDHLHRFAGITIHKNKYKYDFKKHITQLFFMLHQTK